MASSEHAISATAFLDPRFNTLMFQSGNTGNFATPRVTAAAPVTLSLKKALAKGPLATGAKLAVSGLPLGLSKGQKLKLPNGQVLVTSAKVLVGSTNVPVNAATIKAETPVGAPVGVVGGVKVTGSGFLNGPVGLLFCANASSVPVCTGGTNVYVPYIDGGFTLYATTATIPGTTVGLVAQSQSGNSPGRGFQYAGKEQTPDGPAPAGVGAGP